MSSAQAIGRWRITIDELDLFESLLLLFDISTLTLLAHVSDVTLKVLLIFFKLPDQVAGVWLGRALAGLDRDVRARNDAARCSATCLLVICRY